LSARAAPAENGVLRCLVYSARSLKDVISRGELDRLAVGAGLKGRPNADRNPDHFRRDYPRYADAIGIITL